MAPASVSGGVDFAREVIERALGPERAADLLGRLTSASETRPFEFLRRVPPERIAALLRGESPRRWRWCSPACTRLSRPECSRACPKSSSRTSRCGSRAWATPAHESSSRSRQVIRQKLGAAVERKYSASGGAKALAGILNHADRTTERNVLESLPAPTRISPRRCAACCSCSRTSSSSTSAPSNRCCARSTRRTSCWPCAAPPRT